MRHGRPQCAATSRPQREMGAHANTSDRPQRRRTGRSKESDRGRIRSVQQQKVARYFIERTTGANTSACCNAATHPGASSRHASKTDAIAAVVAELRPPSGGDARKPGMTLLFERANHRGIHRLCAPPTHFRGKPAGKTGIMEPSRTFQNLPPNRTLSSHWSSENDASRSLAASAVTATVNPVVSGE